ncbi:MAG: SPOR domain-containing protein [Treponema sp.]|jgi:DedD protein|nr:SPOR domain-containing protein [Treponema sp.]
MEKKKILLVAVSVGIFLVIAIGAAILIFSPQNELSTNAVVMERPIQPGYEGTYHAAEPASVYPQPYGAEPGFPDIQAGRELPGEFSGQEALPREPLSSTNTAIQENNIYISGDTSAKSYVRESGNSASQTQVVIVPRPKAAAVPLLPRETQAPKTAAAPRDTPAPKSTAAVKSPTPVPPAKTATKPPAQPAQAKKPAAKPAAAQSRNAYDTYWVQAGAFSTKVHADGVKEALAAKGITSIIENRDVGGKTFYRVRIGPYTSQNEADYWLALIQTLDGFEQSQVWKSQAQRLN